MNKYSERTQRQPISNTITGVLLRSIKYLYLVAQIQQDYFSSSLVEGRKFFLLGVCTVCEKRLLASSCPSVRPHGPTRSTTGHVCLFVLLALQPNVVVFSTARWQALASSFSTFLDHTQRRVTVGRTSLDE